MGLLQPSTTILQPSMAVLHRITGLLQASTRREPVEEVRPTSAWLAAPRRPRAAWHASCAGTVEGWEMENVGRR